jgi:predicted metal-binding protein
MLNGNELVKIALESGAANAAILDTAIIQFHEDFRKACEKNFCRKYDTNWMGPPAIGPIQDLRQKAVRYRQGLLFQTVHTVASNFDMKGMLAAGKIHDKVFRTLLAGIQKEFPEEEILPLNAGCCSLCEECGYLTQEPCRHPDQAVSSVEAYGINVIALQKSAGLPYYKGKESVIYVGLILFNKAVSPQLSADN